MSWPLVALGDIFEIARGGSPRPIDKFLTDDPEGINWISISDASESSKYISVTKRRIDKSGVAKSRMVFDGDFLLTNSMSFGRPYIMKTSGCIHDGWLVLSGAKKLVHSDFFYHLLGSKDVYARFSQLAAGVTVKNLNIDLVKSVEVPLPPLAEQRRIAAILDQADDLRRKRREALERLQELKSGSFESMFLNPHGPVFPLGTIESLTATTQYGTSSKAGEVGDFPILRMGNLSYEGEIDVRELKYIDLTPSEVAKYTVRPGDILFNRTNSPDLVGKTAVFQVTDVYAFAGYLVRLRVNERAVPEFVSGYLNSKRGKTILRGMCKAIIGMANINAQELRSIAIPLPPLDLQRAFAARVAAIDALKAQHRAHLAKLDALFASLQHRAFRGEL